MNWKHNFRTQTHTPSLRFENVFVVCDSSCCCCCCCHLCSCCYYCIRHALHIRTHTHTCHLLSALFSNLCTKNIHFLHCLHLHCVISPKKKKQFWFRLSLSFTCLPWFCWDWFLHLQSLSSFFKNQKPKKIYFKNANKHNQTNANTNFRILFAPRLCSSRNYTLLLIMHIQKKRCCVCEERRRQRKINK